MTSRQIWFEYDHGAGRLTAVPVSIEGWLVLFGSIIVPVLLTLTLGLAVISVHPLLFALILVGSLGASLAVLLTFVVRNGRRRS